MKSSRIFEVYEDRNRLYTKSISPGAVYGEAIVRHKGEEYREWDPKRSKLAAAIKKGAPNIFLRRAQKVLYLGAASGTTASHVSDIVGREGFVFALDFAPRPVRDLVFLAEKRKNIAPLLQDASHPEKYADRITQADYVFQDIAQRSQVAIFLKNVSMFLKKGCHCALCVKSRSVDVVRKPGDVFREVYRALEGSVTVVDSRDLAPFERDHMIFFCKKR